MLTAHLREVLIEIEAFQSQKGRSPTVAEISDALGLKSKSRVHGNLVRLEERGYIIRTLDRQQRITVLKPQRVLIPIYRAGDNKLMDYLP